MTSLSSSGSRGSSSSCSRSAEPLALAPRVGWPPSRNDASSVASSFAAVPGRPRPAGSSRGRRHDRRQLGVAPAQRARAVLVGVHRGIGELPLELGVLGEQLVERGRSSCVPPGWREWIGAGIQQRRRSRNARWAPDEASWLPPAALAGLALAEALLELARRGRRCPGSSACPCRTGGTRSRPRRGSTPLLAGAARGERVAAGAGDLCLDVRGVDVGLHGVSSRVDGRRVAGRESGVNRSRIDGNAQARTHIPRFVPPIPLTRS